MTIDWQIMMLSDSAIWWQVMMLYDHRWRYRLIDKIDNAQYDNDRLISNDAIWSRYIDKMIAQYDNDRLRSNDAIWWR